MLRPDRDVTDIRAFYHSRLGRLVTRRINRMLRLCWPGENKHTILAIGYGLPFLAAWPNDKALAVMTASQGVIRWPSQGPCATVLTEDHILPFADESFDRIIVAHELENTDHPAALLNEIWRVLSPQGRLLMIVPNRLGLWARMDATPFGFGRAYSSRQLAQLLQSHRYVRLQRHYGLYTPPSQKRIWLSLAPVWEWLGPRFFPQIGGVIVVEAAKQIYSVTPLSKIPPGRKQQAKDLAGQWVPHPAG